MLARALPRARVGLSPARALLSSQPQRYESPQEIFWRPPVNSEPPSAEEVAVVLRAALRDKDMQVKALLKRVESLEVRLTATTFFSRLLLTPLSPVRVVAARAGQCPRCDNS